jgi:hypothetical protein
VKRTESRFQKQFCEPGNVFNDVADFLSHNSKGVGATESHYRQERKKSDEAPWKAVRILSRNKLFESFQGLFHVYHNLYNLLKSDSVPIILILEP